MRRYLVTVKVWVESDQEDLDAFQDYVREEVTEAVAGWPGGCPVTDATVDSVYAEGAP